MRSESIEEIRERIKRNMDRLALTKCEALKTALRQKIAEDSRTVREFEVSTRPHLAASA